MNHSRSNERSADQSDLDDVTNDSGRRRVRGPEQYGFPRAKVYPKETWPDGPNGVSSDSDSDSLDSILAPPRIRAVASKKRKKGDVDESDPPAPRTKHAKSADLDSMPKNDEIDDTEAEFAKEVDTSAALFRPNSADASAIHVKDMTDDEVAKILDARVQEAMSMYDTYDK